MMCGQRPDGGCWTRHGGGLLRAPLISLWLDACSTAFASPQGRWMVELHRQQTFMATEVARLSAQFWLDAWKVRKFRK